MNENSSKAEDVAFLLEVMKVMMHRLAVPAGAANRPFHRPRNCTPTLPPSKPHAHLAALETARPLETLQQYRNMRRVYHYTYDKEDTAARAACTTDVRPFAYSLLPASAVFWVQGRVIQAHR